MESLIELSMEILDAVTELYNKSLKAGDGMSLRIED